MNYDPYSNNQIKTLRSDPTGRLYPLVDNEQESSWLPALTVTLVCAVLLIVSIVLRGMPS